MFYKNLLVLVELSKFITVIRCKKWISLFKAKWSSIFLFIYLNFIVLGNCSLIMQSFLSSFPASFVPLPHFVACMKVFSASILM